MAGAAADRDRLRVFVSYARRDMEAVDRLVAALEGAGFDVLIDRRDLPYGEEWQSELADLIRAADTVLWLVSFQSVQSRWCNWELGEVQRLNKRLAPVAIEPVPSDALPEALGRIHMLPAEGVFDIGRHLSALVETLNNDRVWLKEHTRLADSARQWILRNRSPALLLRGVALKDAQAWADRRPRTAPPPSEDILALLLASRRAQGRGQRVAAVASLAVAIMGIGLAALAYWQRGIAVEQQHIAEAQRNQALRGQSLALAGISREHFGRGDYDTALALALEALPDRGRGIERPYVAAAEAALFAAVTHLHQNRLLAGHSSLLDRARFSSNGERVLTNSVDGTTRVWDADTGAQLAVIRHATEGHDSFASSAEFSPDGSRVLTVADGRTRILRADTGAEILVLQKQGDNNTAVYSPDGRRIAADSYSDNIARIWDAGDGREVATFRGHGDAVVDLAFSPDGSMIVTSSMDGTARIWNAADGTLIHILEGHRAMVLSASFSDDGARILTNSGDWTARVWNVADGAPIAILDGHQEEISSAKFSADARRVLTASLDGTARIWDANTGAELLVLRGHSAGIDSAEWSPDESTILTASHDRTARIWDAATGARIFLLGGHAERVRSASFSPDGSRLVTASYDHTARIWTVRPPYAKENLILGGDSEAIRFISESRDGSRVLTADEKTIRLWDLSEERKLATVETPGLASASVSPDGERFLAVHAGAAEMRSVDDGTTLLTIGGSSAAIVEAFFSPDGTSFVTVDERGAARIWSTADGTERVRLGSDGEGRHPAFSPDGAKVITGSGATALIWNAETGVRSAVLSGMEDPAGAWRSDVKAASISSGGRRALTVTASGTASLWDAETGVRIAALSAERETGEGLDLDHRIAASFSPDGQFVVTLSDERLARVWSAEDGRSIAVLRGHAKYVEAAAFSLDSKKLVTTSWDGSARVWDARSGSTVAELDLNDRGDLAQFSFAGRSVLIGTSSGRAGIYRVFPSTQELVDYARSVMSRELTPEERRRFVVE